MKLIITNLLLFFLLCLSLSPCLAGITPSQAGNFCLVLQGENNLFPVAFAFKDIEEELASGKNIKISQDFLSRTSISFSLPLWKRATTIFGLTFQKASYLQISDQTLHFYQDYNNPKYSPAKKSYDLAGNSNEYVLLGTYAVKKWDFDSVKIAIRGDLFTCYDYQKINAIGEGWIKKKIDGSKSYELFADYRREWLEQKNPWGWGVGLNWDLYFKQNSLELYLNLQNLPGWVYFSKLHQENRMIDTEGGSISPITIKGFQTEGPKYLNIPLKAKAELLYTWSYGGVIAFETLYCSAIQDFTFGYHHPLGVVKLTTSINPVFKNYGLGLAAKYGELVMLFSLNTPSRLQGITFQLQI